MYFKNSNLSIIEGRKAIILICPLVSNLILSIERVPEEIELVTVEEDEDDEDDEEDVLGIF